MIEIESGDVMDMRDASFSEILDEINSKASQTRMSVAFSLAALVAAGIAGLATGGLGLLVCVIAVPAGAIGKWLDSYLRTTVLYYDLEGDAETAYSRLIGGFDGLVGCSAKWHVASGGAVQGLTAWKRNAGASYLIKRKSTKLDYTLPLVIKSNITPPALYLGRQVMFFLPDIVLVQESNRVGAVSYAELNVRWQESRFIETEHVPNDASIVDHTWEHPNKGGGPDKRFKYNRRLPICLYEAMHLTSNSGVNELLEFSRTGVAAAFEAGCRMLAALPREREAVIALPSAPANDATNASPVHETKRPLSTLKVGLLTILGGLLAISAVTVVFVLGLKKADLGLPRSLVPEISDKLVAAKEGDGLREKIGAAPSSQSVPVVRAGVAESVLVAKQDREQSTIRYTKTAVNLRDGPGTKFTVISVVPKAAQVSLIEVKGEWSRVRVNANTVGWMANSTITEH